MRDLMEKYSWKEPFQPMNVQNAGAKTEDLFQDDAYIAELKRDGDRRIVIDGRVFGRNLSTDKKNKETFGLPVEKTANVPHLAAMFRRYPGCVFDGEVHYPQGKSNLTAQIMGCSPEKALMRQGFGEFETFPGKGASELHWRMPNAKELHPMQDWVRVDKASEEFLQGERGPIHYMIFDVMYLNGESLMELPWEERSARLQDWFENVFVPFPEYAGLVTLSAPFETEDGKRTLLKWAEDHNEEGIVFKRRQSKYQPGKRPVNHWYRIKGKIYADVVVMGCEEPEKEHKGKTSELKTWRYWQDGSGGFLEFDGSEAAYRYADEIGESVRPVSKFYAKDWIGSIVFGLYKEIDGERVLTKAGTCSGMDEENRQTWTALFRAGDAAGQVIEISAMERTDKGLFRHPQYERVRYDKSAADCLWENEVEAASEDANG